MLVQLGPDALLPQLLQHLGRLDRARIGLDEVDATADLAVGALGHQTPLATDAVRQLPEPAARRREDDALPDLGARVDKRSDERQDEPADDEAQHGAPVLRRKEIRVAHQPGEEVDEDDLGVGGLGGEGLHEERRHARGRAGRVAHGVVVLEQEVVGPQRAFLAAGEDGDDARGRGGAQ